MDNSSLGSLTCRVHYNCGGVVLTSRSTALKTSIDNYKTLADSYKAKLKKQQKRLDEMKEISCPLKLE